MISLDLVAELSALASAILVGSFKTVSIHSVGSFYASYQKPFFVFYLFKTAGFYPFFENGYACPGGRG